jgi:hypothetical protein
MPNGAPDGYESYQIVGQTGWAVTSDVVSLLGTNHSRIAGTVRNLKFCVTAICLKPVNAVALSAVLDENTLALSQGQVLWDTTVQFTVANSMAVDVGLVLAFYLGGQVMWTKQNGFMPGLREALWIRAEPACRAQKPHPTGGGPLAVVP